MYGQKKNVPMGYSLGSLLANILMTKCGNDQFELAIHTFYLYRRYVDDVFYILNPSARVDEPMNKSNSPHSSVKFTTDGVKQ